MGIKILRGKRAYDLETIHSNIIIAWSKNLGYKMFRPFCYLQIAKYYGSDVVKRRRIDERTCRTYNWTENNVSQKILYLLQIRNSR